MKRRMTLIALVHIAVLLMSCVPAVLTAGSGTTPNTGGGLACGPLTSIEAVRQALVPGSTLLSVWGDPRDGGARSHQGEDLGAPYGAPIRAPERGTVTRNYYDSLGGHSAMLRTVSGYDWYLTHMAAASPVAEGASVEAGQQVGQVGTSGNADGTPPHLHYQVRPVGGAWQNPAELLAGGLLGGDGNCPVGPDGWPVPPGTPITRGFGCSTFWAASRGNCPPGQYFHNGVDWAAAVGTPIYAVSDQVIQFAGVDQSGPDCSATLPGSQPPHRGYGRYIRATDSAGRTYWYAHASALRVTAGQQVAAGTQIADMGSSGCSSGSHVHLRVEVGGQPVDPLAVLQEP